MQEDISCQLPDEKLVRYQVGSQAKTVNQSAGASEFIEKLQNKNHYTGHNQRTDGGTPDGVSDSR